MEEVKKFYNTEVTKRNCKLARIEARLDNEDNKKKYLHKDHNSSLFYQLGANNYVFYKILFQIWSNEEVIKQDIEFLSKCKLFGLRSIIKRKFGQDLVFGTSEMMTKHLNLLRKEKSLKRVEENTKFVMKKFLKFLSKKIEEESPDIQDFFYQQYYKECMEQKEFESLFKFNENQKIFTY